MYQKERKKSDISQVLPLACTGMIHSYVWNSCDESQHLKVCGHGSLLKKTEQCCYGDERAEIKDEGSLDPCSVPYPWSLYLGKIYEDKVVNTSDRSEFPSYGG